MKRKSHKQNNGENFNLGEIDNEIVDNEIEIIVAIQLTYLNSETPRKQTNSKLNKSITILKNNRISNKKYLIYIKLTK